MLPSFLQLYHEMLADIAEANNSQSEKLKKIESCFQVVNHYWANLRGEVFSFTTDGEKIYFYKEIMACFLAEMRFYELCYYAELFWNFNSSKLKEEFIERELDRLNKYTFQHAEAYSYYLEKKTDRDIEFFARDVRIAEKYSNTIADFIALNRYVEYIKTPHFLK